jgi:hypothetical protein
MIDPQYAEDNENYLSVYSFVEDSGEWRESPGTILIPGDYEMTVEALSSNTRRTSIRLIITHDGGAWNIRNAPNVR